MLPLLAPTSGLHQRTQTFLATLEARGFSGDMESSYSQRLAVATDNSVYQQLPQAVLLPRVDKDLQLLGELAKDFPDISFGPRGGGTGTNGQSLTPGIVVDLSRHMNGLIELNLEQGWVRVQAGMVKDQLNDILRPHGFFFAPDLSTSNRATIGGMINTDASGQGSLVYGKTSDHLLGLRAILADGTVLDTQPLGLEQAEALSQGADRIGQLYRQLLTSCGEHQQRIKATFPRLNRFLTGYDLEHALDTEAAQVDMGRLIAGSEGTLAFVTEATLSITPIPKHKCLVNIKYDSFESALRHAPVMVQANATSVETVDSKVLNLARQDIIWHAVSPLIQDVPGKEVQGLNMVEYNSEDAEQMAAHIQALEARLRDPEQAAQHGVIGYQLTYDTAEIAKIYAMRKKAVGLLGKSDSWQKPVAFAEDTAVPPENLADFILEFRALLDARGLKYGMFGHVDAGVLHVRPALDLCDPAQESLMHALSDQIVALVAKYGGLMWGEHGKGYRSEYGPAFFGDILFSELRKIKAAFDPHNQMNPGKICTPINSDDELVRVSGEKRAHWDRQIPIRVRDDFATAMSCNGNGLCFNYDSKSPMCPSFKASGDRRHSPKGRAGMMREWLRLLARHDVSPEVLERAALPNWLLRLKNRFSQANREDFSHEVKQVMDECLACKACASQCPVNVDVPGFRARFLAIYHGRYARPLKDYMVANVESMTPWLARVPRVSNIIINNPLSQRLLSQTLGYLDTPLLSVPSLRQRADKLGLAQFDLAALKTMDAATRDNTVIIVQDPFTSFYEAGLVEDFARLLIILGYTPVLLPFIPNGKPQHVKGFLREFGDTARTAAALLNEIADTGVAMVGLDASLVLCYRDEYAKALGAERGRFEVLLSHEWLLRAVQAPLPAIRTGNAPFALFAHCTEKTQLPESEKQWQQIFTAFGLTLTPVSVGCCGMAGTYGHEREHLQRSRQIFSLSWPQQLADYDNGQVLVSGYSCRSQVKRLAGYQPKHPIQGLLAAIKG